MRIRKLRFLIVLGLTGLSVPASAQTAEKFNVNRFEPAERGSDWFTADSLDFRGALRPSVGVTGDYSYRSVVVYNNDDSVRASAVRNLFVLHGGASLVFLDRFRIGASMPFLLFSDGHRATLGTKVFETPSKEQAIGDLRLSADMRVFGQYGGGITGAIGAQVSLPTGDKDSYMSDGQARVQPRAQLAGDLGPVAYAARVGYQFRGLDHKVADTPIMDEVTFTGSVGLRTANNVLLIGPEVFGSTTVDNDQAFKKNSTPVEGLFGVHAFLPGGIRLGAGGGAGLSRGYGSPEARALFSLEYKPEIDAAPLDRDSDGVNDDRDACPDTAGVASEDPQTNGCPPAGPKDHDLDSILDSEDACVDVPGVRSDDPKKNGCPLPLDKDSDGIVDSEDACVDVAGVKQDDPKKNGCPADKDNDGVPDATDACADIAGVKSANPKFNGCPEDKDGDGVKNDVDACPDEPGKADADPKKNGCPKAFVSAGSIKILDQVKFKTGSAQLDGKASDEVLGAVLKVLTDHKEIKKVRIEGHTDNKGAAATNKKLSGDRAASVVKWLVGKGIAKDRLSSVGFGLEKPIDSNDTDAGRANNRRVEFVIEDPPQTN